MATIKDISLQAEVSPTTVSRVLNRDENLSVSSEVRNRIFTVAHELNYVPPRLRHHSGTSFIIGVADWHIIRNGCENTKLSSLECLVKTLNISGEISFVRMRMGKTVSVDGIIAFGNINEEELFFLQEQSFSIVFINSEKRDYLFDRIVMDYEEGIVQAVNYLMEKEYDTIGYVGGIFQQAEVTIGSHRLDCFVEILKKNNRWDPVLIHVGALSKEDGYNLMMRALQSNTLARAVLLGSDEIAEGALQALHERNIRIPEDVALVLYRDIETLPQGSLRYPTIRMYPDFVWETAIKLLMDRMLGKRNEAMTVYVPAKFERL